MKSGLFMALSAIYLFLGASSACAELVRVTYTGIVGYGYDETGLFGPPETDLEGESYQATFVFDDYGAYYYRAGYGYTDLLSSGPSLDWGVPFVTATTTINGRSVTVEGGDVGELTWNDDGDTLGSSAYYAVFDTINDMDDFVTTNTGALPTTLNHNLTYTVLPTDKQGAYFNFNGVIGGIPLAFVNAHGQGDILSVTVSVPEPATWAMMLLGFAGLGVAGYRAKRRSAAAAA